MKKRKLKKWTKHLITLFYTIAFILITIYGINNLKNKFNERDKQKQHTCSLYELHNN